MTRAHEVRTRGAWKRAEHVGDHVCSPDVGKAELFMVSWSHDAETRRRARRVAVIDGREAFPPVGMQSKPESFRDFRRQNSLRG